MRYLLLLSVLVSPAFSQGIITTIAGSQVPVVITIAGQASPAVTIAVQ